MSAKDSTCLKTGFPELYAVYEPHERKIDEADAAIERLTRELAAAKWRRQTEQKEALDDVHRFINNDVDVETTAIARELEDTGKLDTERRVRAVERHSKMVEACVQAGVGSKRALSGNSWMLSTVEMRRHAKLLRENKKTEAGGA